MEVEQLSSLSCRGPAFILNPDTLLSPLLNHGFNLFDYRSVPLMDMEVDGITWIEPAELYNIMMQKEKFPCVSDPNYLVLIGRSAVFTVLVLC